jgi:hypothetical protein
MESDSLKHARDDMTRHRITDLIVNSKLDVKWIGERLAKYESKLEPAYAADLGTRIEALRTRLAVCES